MHEVLMQPDQLNAIAHYLFVITCLSLSMNIIGFVGLIVKIYQLAKEGKFKLDKTYRGKKFK